MKNFITKQILRNKNLISNRQLFIVVNKKNRQYMPKEIIVMGGDSPDDINELNKVTIKQHEDGDILLLEKCQKAYDYIEIRIKSCQSN